MSEMFDSIKIIITKTLKIQKKENIKSKKNMLYIVVTQVDVSLKENMLKHKKNVNLKNVCNIKKYIYHRNLLIIYNTKKYVYLKNNKSWCKRC